ncbi:zinc transporter binding subunit ZevA [Lonepinella sp. BR2930]|uniref:zinc transporter binding subunit ZevA n=1 Tax=Lonepinella sp. BR2930 TaxID=3434554 RepID=UPI003F6DFA17
MKKFFLFLTALFAFMQNVQAHPHAFIGMKTTPLVENNTLKGFSVQWLLDEASSAELLYDLKVAHNDLKAKQAIVDDMVKNTVSEHYFSYLYDKQGNRVKYTSHPANYDIKAVGNQILYHFDFFLSQPQKLIDNQFVLMIYDPTYYVSMYYDNKSAVDFSQLPSNCHGEMVDQTVDEKTKQYAQALDKTQREADFSLGKQFAQKVILQCQ